MDLGLNGTRVLITAGASGLGHAMAQAFLSEGAQVSVLDVDERALESAASSLAGARAVKCDVSDLGQVEAAVSNAASHMGGIDVLVNNAGISGGTAGVENIPPADWQSTLDVNLTGTFNVTRTAVPYLTESQNASMLNISSVAGLYGFALRAPYSTSKWGVIGFTKTMAIELGERGIRVNALCPGSLDSPRGRRVLNELAARQGVSVAEVEQKVLSVMSIKKFVQLEEVARVACFLSSPSLSTLSGQVVAVDGNTASMA